tara:strand:- start:21774 stop:22067 length:294 start_codon:yes stop_codon:yes gene_type:complete
MKGDGKIIEALNTTSIQEFAWNGGEGVFLAESDDWTDGSGNPKTIKLMQLIGDTFVDIQDATLAASGGFKFVTTAPKLAIALSGTSTYPVYVSVQGL